MTLHVGRVTLNESAMRPVNESANNQGRSVKLAGVLAGSGPPLAALHDDVLGLPASVVPVVFDDKATRNGYYLVESSNSSLTEIPYELVARLEWEIQLMRQGAANEVDLESRFAGPINRLNDHSLGGERAHTPPGGHTAYLALNSTPGSVTRTGSDGALKTYLDLDFGINPRWQCPVTSYKLGRVRVEDTALRVERAGTGVQLRSPWTLSNSLIEVTANGTFLDFRTHNGTVWSAIKQFGLTVGGSGIGTPVAVSVLHNEYERITLRLLYNRSPSGRVVVDLTLRRGARFAEFLVKANSSTTLGIKRTTNEAGTGASGYVRATSNDGDGHRYIIGSLRSFTGDLTAGGISKASVTRFDAFVGAEVSGSSAVSGDQAANLMLQYIGSASETVQAVRR
jgi:hypothetical protein